MEGHRDLVVWQKSMQMVTDIYNLTRRFPKEETFGLSVQLRRAAVSVPSNIAEGHGRSSTREFHQFLSNARGSLMEVETQLEISFNLHYLDRPAFDRIIKQSSEVGRMLTGLRAWAEETNS